MPIYEYICQECGEEFEEFDGQCDPSYKPACPECGSEDTAESLFSTLVGYAASESNGSCPSSAQFA